MKSADEKKRSEFILNSVRVCVRACALLYLASQTCKTDRDRDSRTVILTKLITCSMELLGITFLKIHKTEARKVERILLLGEHWDCKYRHTKQEIK